MALFDFLGVGKSVKPEDAAGGEAEAPVHAPNSPVSPRKFWLRLAAADILVVVACLALVGSRFLHHSAQPSIRPKPTEKPAPKPEPVAEAPKSEEAKTESNKAEPEKADPAKIETKKPEPSKPDSAKNEAKKPEAPKPSAAKAAAKTPEAEKPISPTAKVPLGSPSVHAKALPERAAALIEDEPSKSAKSKPGTVATAKPEAKAVSKPANFDYVNPDAKEVYLIGMFLVRTGGKRKMYKDSKGTWETTVYLNFGQSYKYQYEVLGKDGKRTLTPKKSLDVVE